MNEDAVGLPFPVILFRACHCGWAAEKANSSIQVGEEKELRGTSASQHHEETKGGFWVAMGFGFYPRKRGLERITRWEMGIKYLEGLHDVKEQFVWDLEQQKVNLEW